MSILPIILFLLGVMFLFLGWRSQNPPNEEVMTALRGLAYLKREIHRVEDQVHKIDENMESTKQLQLREIELREIALQETERRERELKQMELREAALKEKGKLYSLNAKEHKERSGVSDLKSWLKETTPQTLVNTSSQHKVSPKYQQVLELAEQGYQIAEIAQRLLLSQDAVNMVLRTHRKGG